MSDDRQPVGGQWKGADERTAAPDAPVRRPPTIGPVILHQFTLVPFAGCIDVLRPSGNPNDRSRQATRRWTIANGSPFARQPKAMFGATPRAVRGPARGGAG